MAIELYFSSESALAVIHPFSVVDGLFSSVFDTSGGLTTIMLAHIKAKLWFYITSYCSNCFQCLPHLYRSSALTHRSPLTRLMTTLLSQLELSDMFFSGWMMYGPYCSALTEPTAGPCALRLSNSVLLRFTRRSSRPTTNCCSFGLRCQNSMLQLQDTY